MTLASIIINDIVGVLLPSNSKKRRGTDKERGVEV